MVAKHFKRLCVGLGALGAVGSAAAAFVGMGWLIVNHLWFAVPLIVIIVAYVLGAVTDKG